MSLVSCPQVLFGGGRTKNCTPLSRHGRCQVPKAICPTDHLGITDQEWKKTRQLKKPHLSFNERYLMILLERKVKSYTLLYQSVNNMYNFIISGTTF